MKNKARCRYLKKIFACCTLAFLLFSISVPCFASVVYPTQGDSFTGRRTFIPSEGWTYDNCVIMSDVVEKAYKLNYFSAGVPVAVVSIFGNYVGVLVVSSTATYSTQTVIPGGTFTGLFPAVPGDSRRRVTCSVDEHINSSNYVYLRAIDGLSNYSYAMSLYYLNEDNTFCHAVSVPFLQSYNEQNPTDSSYVAGFATVSSYFCPKSEVIALRFGDDDWRSPYSDTFSDIDPILGALDEWYDDRIASPGGVDNNNHDYVLDIPSIITAIPNAAKQIINNAFGFEIFGINVAGFLSVLLIVSIVGFVVKWLMSR